MFSPHPDAKDNKESDTQTLVPLPPAMFCPLSKKIMKHPVATPSGTSYEKSFIEDYLRTHNNIDPEENLVNPEQLVRNIKLEEVIEAVLKNTENENLNLEELFSDPIHHEPFINPVLTEEKQTYSRSTIEK